MINCCSLLRARLFHTRRHDHLLFITSSAIISHARALSLAIRYFEHNYYKFNKRNEKSVGSTIKSFCHGSRKEKLFQSCRSSLYDPACSQSIHPYSRREYRCETSGKNKQIRQPQSSR